MKKFQISNDGQSLWEVIVALAIASLIALGLVKATGLAVKGSRFSADQSQLTALAQERISTIINYKNQNAKSFWEKVDNQTILSTLGIGSEEYDSQNDFCRKTTVVNSLDWPSGYIIIGTEEMAKITVDIFWGSKTSNPDCDNIDFSHTLHFETNVTN